MPLDARVTQALSEVAQEHGMSYGFARHYPSGHIIATLGCLADPARVVGMLPMDETLRDHLTTHSQTRAGLRRILRDDGFTARGAHDPARDLCRLGLVACHALAGLFPAAAVQAGLSARVCFDDHSVAATVQADPMATVALRSDEVRLLWQFTPVERYARAWHLFRRQIARADIQRASS